MKPASPSIAIVGMACVYPDARTPAELWENVLAQRRAFRHLPRERLRTEDYFSGDPQAPDCTYSMEAAVIEGYEFNRVAFRVVGSTFRSADLAHWLALDVASRALADAGFAEGRGLPRESSGVLLGNSLTGEFSRAGLVRLRWPYVRRVLEAALEKEGWLPEKRQEFLADLEAEYKSPFPPVGEETLAGGLANTIAGRICNQFDLKGGGYTLDGACASSLLAVSNACAALTTGDLDVALAGGVDLSLDPFELVGFAKTGALATDEMRVFDRRSAGFWPGEGCGFVALMRHEDALAQGRRVYAVIRGWGISSDGHGGITRPEVGGQLEALRHAYRRAGFGADTVAYCEGHGTGTAVGDATELEVLSQARRAAQPEAPPAVLGSVKANIGHTKAAAGLAGLIKATMAVHTQVLPPTTGCDEPHPLLKGPSAALRVLREPEVWPEERPLRASVSAMGFGGINVHVVLEGVGAGRRAALSSRELALSRSQQDAELFLLAARDTAGLAKQVDKVLALAPRISRAELSDLAARLASDPGPGTQRAALVAGKPAELAERLRTLQGWLAAGAGRKLGFAEGVFLGSGTRTPRIGFLFPGQGSPTHLDGGLWRRRFDAVRTLYAQAALPADGDTVSTRVVQPAVVTSSLAGLAVLNELGLTADAALGHSLGEIVALHWAGVFDAATLRQIAQVRGAAMTDLGSPTGAMLAIEAPWQEVQPALAGLAATIVGYNSPRQTVVAGDADDVTQVSQRAHARGWGATMLPVSHAFHTPLVAGAVPLLAGELARLAFKAPSRRVFSTITGEVLGAEEDLRELLCQQVTSPVRFSTALAALLGAGSAMDLLIEVGPGKVLTGLAGDLAEVPVVALDTGGSSLKGLLLAVGAAFAAGAGVKSAVLFADRFTRPFDLDWKPKFFGNPCELAPVSGEPSAKTGVSIQSRNRRREEAEAELREEVGRLTAAAAPSGVDLQPLEVVREFVAERAELPVSAVQDDSRMLSDLHLNSITVSQLVSKVANRLGLSRIAGLTDFADASVAEVGRAMEELKRTGSMAHADDKRRQPPGVDLWIHGFAVELTEAKCAPVPQSRRRVPADRVAVGSDAAGSWRVFAPKGHPFAARLGEKLGQLGRAGVLLCLPENPAEESIGLLLESARAVLAMKSERRFVLVQHGWGGSGFARTLHLETPDLTTCVVNVPPGHLQAADWAVAEAMSATGYTEAHYDDAGRRREPRLKLVPLDDGSEGNGGKNFPIGPEDVLLVTGGGKGIAAECALALGRETGAQLALLGRSDPAVDKELAENLARFTAAGVRCAYVRADVTDAEAVRQAVGQAEQTLGPVTAFLHGAGTNTPQLIGALEEAAFRRTVAPKIQGARNVLAAVDPNRLRLFITFGSIIARAGLRGEADYATANEWLTALTEDFRVRHPQCRCLALEWSVWSGAGMGERLGRMETLIAEGIMPIPPDEGVRVLREALQRSAGPVAMVVAGRFGEAPTLKFSEPELPLQRFLERKRAHYPGVELIVDAELSVAADPYLNDHVVQKEKLFPAVLGLEAMAQAAMALAGYTTPPSFEKVELTRPVAVPDPGTMTIRLAALRRGPDLVEVCLRCEATDFHVDHFRALCRFGAAPASGLSRLELAAVEAPRLPLDPRRELYGGILFHEGRFRRVAGYRLLRAKECVAELTPDDGAPWFGSYLPGELVLGDPGARDAALHAIQACIPHARILPTGVDHIVVRRTDDPGARLVRAKERLRNGNEFVYDLEVTNGAGEVLERWEGLQLRAVGAVAAPEAWPEPLVGPYVERRLEEILPELPVKVALVPGGRPGRSDDAIRRALGNPERIWRRSDGKPLALAGLSVSAAHALDLTLAVAAASQVGCDLEEVTARPERVWGDLLGTDDQKLAGRVARERPEAPEMAATRVWSARESLKKSGAGAKGPLVLDAVTPDGWVLLRSGSRRVATFVAAIRGAEKPLAIAVTVDCAAATGAVRATAGEAAA